MITQYSGTISRVCKEIFNKDVSAELARPDEQFGDYSTNVAMQIAGKLDKPPREIAELIVKKLKENSDFAEVSVAGPGFINIRLIDSAVFSAVGQNIPMQTGKILLEYSCPNPFKDLHVGHLYQTVLGDALSRVYERLGWKVFRVTYGGDVGLHVARSLWAIIDELGGESPQNLQNIVWEDRAKWLADMYVKGTKADESDESAKKSIADINKRIYELHKSGDKKSDFAQIYWTARQWSYDFFSRFYRDIKIKPFDLSIGESEVFDSGLKIVEQNIKTVFIESDGAIILNEEKSGLHTRVFVTSEGLATYEAKDLGVIYLETNSFDYEKRIIMTGNEQKEYMKVVFSALKLVNPQLGAKQTSLTHGLVKFESGQKMSSRLGNVTRAVDVIDAAKQAAKDNSIALGAVKYTFLKNSIGGDIAFDLQQSVSLEGNSGPYLQYAHTRAKSILGKQKSKSPSPRAANLKLDKYERRLASRLTRFGEELMACIDDNSLHHLCNYLYELSQVFNQFYENSRVIDDPRSAIRLKLVAEYERVLGDGLNTLGIPQPEKM